MLGGALFNLTLALTTFGLIYLIMWGVKKLSVRPQIRSFISGVLWSIILMTQRCRRLRVRTRRPIGTFVGILCAGRDGECRSGSAGEKKA